MVVKVTMFVCVVVVVSSWNYNNVGRFEATDFTKLFQATNYLYVTNLAPLSIIVWRNHESQMYPKLEKPLEGTL